MLKFLLRVVTSRLFTQGSSLRVRVACSRPSLRWESGDCLCSWEACPKVIYLLNSIEFACLGLSLSIHGSLVSADSGLVTTDNLCDFNLVMPCCFLGIILFSFFSGKLRVVIQRSPLTSVGEGSLEPAAAYSSNHLGRVALTS